MQIAVASGKGGTGKTTVATNLAYVASRNDRTVAYLDCDVEEPNGGLFLHPDMEERRPVRVSIPAVDLSLCSACGTCGEICQYSAIVPMNEKVLVFPELCHGCAGCWLACPTGAVTESHRTTGQLETGRAEGVQFAQGVLNIGEIMSPPVIANVKESAPEAELLILDAPPGTSCPVIETVRDADFVLLVTEPTPFGLNDLKLAVEMVRALELPAAIVINRAEGTESETHVWCRNEGLEIIAEIPDDREVAELYSHGALAAKHVPAYQKVFAELLERTETMLAGMQSGASGRVPA